MGGQRGGGDPADRLACSTKDLLDVAETLNDLGAGLRSLGEPWADTTLPVGRMVLTVFVGIAEFERALTYRRTSSGRVAGRAPSVREAAKPLDCHHATLYPALTAASLRP